MRQLEKYSSESNLACWNILPLVKALVESRSGGETLTQQDWIFFSSSHLLVIPERRQQAGLALGWPFCRPRWLYDPRIGRYLYPLSHYAIIVTRPTS